MRTTPDTTLVVGGTGKTGRRVAERLTARGIPIRIGSRTGEPPFDWADDTTWQPALRGVTSAYLAYLPEIGSPAAAAMVGAFARRAVDSGVRRVVLLSGRGSEHARQAELALAGAGADWAVVRSSWLAQNFDEGFFDDAVRSGVLAFPAGSVAEPFVSADDVADLAVAALTNDHLRGRVYEATGPRLLTFADAAAEISRVADTMVRYEPISFDEFAAALLESGVPHDAVAETVAVFRTVLDGRNTVLTNDIEETLGRPATDFADYARTAAAAGAWRPRTGATP